MKRTASHLCLRKKMCHFVQSKYNVWVKTSQISISLSRLVVTRGQPFGVRVGDEEIVDRSGTGLTIE